MKAKLLDLWVRMCNETDGQEVAEYVIAAALAGAVITMVLLSMVGLDEYFHTVIRAVTGVIERMGS